MIGRLPRPLLAALGAATQVRRVPGVLVQVPVLALTTYDRVRRAYDGMALAGEELLTEVLGGEDAPPVPPDRGARPDPVAEAVAHVEDPLDHPNAHRPDLPEPIPGYDAMTLGALRGHLRTMSAQDLARVLAYERAYLARGPMITLLEHRLAKLAADGAGSA